MITLGADNSTVINGREVFRAAIMDNALGVILVHNHPSGTLGASQADEKLTKTMIDAGKLLGIKVLDHIIITAESFYSFKENGLIAE